MKFPKQISPWKILIKNIPKKEGVYYLWKNGSIYYIGSSDNLYRRLDFHPYRKECDYVSFLLCPNGDSIIIERQEVKRFNPIKNKCWRNN